MTDVSNEIGTVTSMFGSSLQRQILEQMKPTFTKIPVDEIIPLTVPVRAVVQEALSLAAWCVADMTELEEAGLDWEKVTELKRAGIALQEAEAEWERIRFGRDEFQSAWASMLAEARVLHDELVHIERYAFRRHPELMELVNRIADQKDDADVIQDINALATLGLDYRNLLEAIGVSPDKMMDAANTSFELSEEKAAAAIQQSETRKQKMLRDQAYTHAKNLMTEIRECGQYVFWKDAERLAGYKNGYFVEYRKRRNNKKQTAQENVESVTDAQMDASAIALTDTIEATQVNTAETADSFQTEAGNPRPEASVSTEE